MPIKSFTILAGNANAPHLARAFASNADCEFIAMCAATRGIEELLLSEFPHIACERDPMSLVTRHVDSALVLSGFSDEELAAARHFVEISDRPIIVATDAAQGPARLFELMAVWQDAPGRLYPIFVSGGEELAKELQALPRASSNRLQVSRIVQSESVRLTQTEVDRWLLQDLSWITQIVEDFKDVTTLESGVQDDRVEDTTIKFTSNDDMEITWTLRTGAASELSVEVRGEEGVPFQRTVHLTEQLIQDITRQFEQLSQQESESAEDPWQNVIRLGQIGATARRSATRRRTLPIYHEEATERSQFKSQMAAVGCFVLLWTMFGVIGLMTFGAMVDPRDREMKTSGSAGFVLNQSEFDGEQLSPAGTGHLREIALQWSETSPVLLIEAETGELDAARKEQVMAAFSEWEIQVDPNRVSARELRGRWFETVMWVGWCVVFFPLVAAILAQGFILLTQ